MRREWHIWDFPDNLYVLINDKVRLEFFEIMYKKFGSQLKYAEFLNKERNTVQGYHYARGWDKRVKHIKFMPLEVLQKSKQFISNSLKQKIENNILEIRPHGGKSIKNPILPIKESPALYRIIAHIIGDGNDSHTPYYANTCKELREQFKKDLQIFGELKTNESTPNTTPCVNFPKIVTRILSFIFDIQFTYPNRIPKHLFQSSEECKAAFLQALFDDEGTISTSLSICMHNLNILNQLKELLIQMNIRTGKISISPYYSKKGKRYRTSFAIQKKDYENFKKKINFHHPNKAKGLEASIRTTRRKVRTRPKLQIEENILEILENRQHTTIELANELQFTINGIYPHLNNLYLEELISKKRYKNKVVWDLF